MTSPNAFTATSAETMRPFGSSMEALPMPPFMACVEPLDLPMVAPAPAPTLPSRTGAVLAVPAAA